MRLIDAHALWVAISNYCNCRDDALLIIDKAPTIDTKPVKHGHWIVADDGVTRCSICYGASDYERNFCGDCGAKMDGGK